MKMRYLTLLVSSLSCVIALQAVETTFYNATSRPMVVWPQPKGDPPKVLADVLPRSKVKFNIPADLDSTLVIDRSVASAADKHSYRAFKDWLEEKSWRMTRLEGRPLARLKSGTQWAAFNPLGSSGRYYVRTNDGKRFGMHTYYAKKIK